MPHRRNNEEAKKLIDRYLEGRCTAEEKLLVEEWFQQETALKGTATAAETTSFNKATKKRMWEALSHHTATKHRFNYRNLALAASIILVIGIALYFYSTLIVNRNSAIVDQKILPGYNQATLILADGTKVELDSAKRGIQIRDEDISYNDGTKIGAKTIVYRDSSIVNSTLLTLSTPKGGQYQIILEDGTKVWLNAASTLKYPSHFSGNTREVYLEGEAYFEVTNNPSIDAMQANRKSYLANRKSTSPFIVKSQNQLIRVLGTEFNLTAYSDDEAVRTTLVHGAVRVQGGEGSPLTLVEPGAQAVLTGNQLSKHQVDASSMTGWMRGTFQFTNSPLSELLRQFSRWYNVDFVYSGKDLPPVRLNGDIHRNVTADKALEILRFYNLSYHTERQANGQLRVVVTKDPS
ncbi:FecR family protein [bacterium A37T11]|nr:FecR family protein [bacterium A37T11]